jgi:phosphoglycerate dehydrogenase-like enzyme
MVTSNPIQVLITVPIAEELIGKLQQISPRVQITLYPAQKGKEIPNNILARTEILYTLYALPELNQCPNLRWVQFHYAGVEFALSSTLFQSPEIVFTTLSGAATPQAAEFAVMALLALGHENLRMMEIQRKAEWDKAYWDNWTPHELRESTVGIVGYGSVGREIARLLQPFNVKILATKRDAMHPQDTGYILKGLGDPEGHLFHRLYPPQALSSMLKECDFVVLTLPLTPETLYTFGKDEIEAMNPKAFLINVCRGQIVDQDALLTALQNKRIAGAALDVFPEEPLPASSLFWKLPNVMITPHVAGNSIHYDERAIELFSENLRRYINGTSLLNHIDPQRQY